MLGWLSLNWSSLHCHAACRPWCLPVCITISASFFPQVPSVCRSQQRPHCLPGHLCKREREATCPCLKAGVVAACSWILDILLYLHPLLRPTAGALWVVVSSQEMLWFREVIDDWKKSQEEFLWLLSSLGDCLAHRSAIGMHVFNAKVTHPVSQLMPFFLKRLVFVSCLVTEGQT